MVLLSCRLCCLRRQGCNVVSRWALPLLRPKLESSGVTPVTRSKLGNFTFGEVGGGGGMVVGGLAVVGRLVATVDSVVRTRLRSPGEDSKWVTPLPKLLTTSLIFYRPLRTPRSMSRTCGLPSSRLVPFPPRSSRSVAVVLLGERRA